MTAKFEAIFVLASTALVLGAYSALNATGFCYMEGRYLSDRERYEHAIAYQAERMADFLPADDPGTYLSRHADCCFISKSDFEAIPFPLINDLLGFKTIWVRVAYRMRQSDIERSPADGDYYEAFVQTTPCGKAIRKTGVRMKNP